MDDVNGTPLALKKGSGWQSDKHTVKVKSLETEKKEHYFQ